MLLYQALIVCSCYLSVLFGQDMNYHIPVPKIEVYRPRGFQISIEDAPGIRLFAFHGNVNRVVDDLETGTLSKDVVASKNGRWVYKDRRIKLKIGDVIHYWLFVIKNNLGYRIDQQTFIVKELIPRIQSHRERPNHEDGEEKTNMPTCQTSSHNATALPEEDDVAFNLKICEEAIFNVTNALVSLQNEISKTKKENQQLLNFIDRIPNSKMLTIVGTIPPEGEARSIVTFILREKLLVNPIIISAHRNSPTNITFVVDTILDKIDILNAGKEHLSTSKIAIQ